MEFLLLFIGFPLVLLARPVYAYLYHLRIPLVTAAILFCLVFMLRDPNFKRSALWTTGPLKSWGRQLLLRSLIVAGFVFTISLLFNPENLFLFPRKRPLKWGLLMLFYPLLSALPQELIYRVFFFHRYRKLFRYPQVLAFASIFAFAFLHIIFENPVAPILTLAGGFLLTTTYTRTGSLITVAIEHGIYGDIILTLGLWSYFNRSV